VVSPSGTPVKPLDDLGSVFLKASKPGEAMTFALPVRTPGIYELFADFVMFPSYGTVQLSLDGTPVGEPFDAYAPELDVSGPIPLGKPDLARGVHDLTVTVTGKNPRSSGMFVSVRRFVLRRP
ncbi:MAG: hypothetical protein JXR77_04740, partial [Lentisphaeria bacterium]|nr:hypothetical protein [Lentisphaeria bacterium]